MTAHSSLSGAAWLARRKQMEQKLIDAGVYSPKMEHDACGVGIVAAIDGKPRRDVVEKGIEALQAIWHRGAVDADGKTGDGAGIHLEIPLDFFRGHIARTGHDVDEGRLAVGMVFLPRTDMGAQERCRCIVEEEILKAGYRIYGWRQVPVDVSIIGMKASATRPEIEQIMFSMPQPGGKLDVEEAERALYVIRKKIENAIYAERIMEFYLCSFSSQSIIYKGMFLAEQVTAFYPDLLDERFVSRFAVYHQRYSTNTFPTWKLAQPFRVLAHNGEINTVRGNENWMLCHEDRMESKMFGADIQHLKPVIESGASDSAALDSVFELMVHGGRDLPMVKTMLVPEAVAPDAPKDLRDLYGYCNAVMEPWDGPAALAAVAGEWVVASVDRNGLRPMRIAITDDNLLLAGSETGMVHLEEKGIISKDRLGPGQMIGVNLKEGKLYHDAELKTALTSRRNWGEWLGRSRLMDDLLSGEAEVSVPTLEKGELRRRQFTAGWTLEDMELLLQPMAEGGKEATGSMGDDSPLAVLSNRYRGLHHFFRQNFSQVTNPPIDSLRERHVMTLRTRLGNLGNILDEAAEQCDHLLLNSPVVTNSEFATLNQWLGDKAVTIDATFSTIDGDDGLQAALDRIEREAEDAVRGGAEHIMLVDRATTPTRMAIPSILAAGAVHAHLVRRQLRTFVSINVASGECLDVHHFAVLIGVGATTVNPWMAEDSIRERHDRGLIPKISADEAIGNFRTAIENGLLKIMSKMGISVLSSYRGGYNFEALGLSRSLVSRYFPPMTSRISGLGLAGIEHQLQEINETAWREEMVTLPVGGFFRFRKSGEAHAFDADVIHSMQHACDTGSYDSWKNYTSKVYRAGPINLRDLLDFTGGKDPKPIEEVESITKIRRKLVSPGISLGALSPESHETLSIAMNRIGAKSDSGEGGEDPARFSLRENGDNPSSAIKQVASGRFGVTAEYLNNCEELEIKVAQGAKPGEGGQLPGIKVDSLIARLRHSTPGVPLISPPPHHDIYSIEDLAQLIYDLKQINPDARVCVKLVASTGIGTIAAGVAKAKADTILISGHGGGTGASPQSSIKHAGLPWEMGLSEVHQVLTMNDLRDKVVLRTDGGLKTGRDIVMAAMLGADEYGIGTSSLIAMGCIMVRQCHSNTCPVGVCTQREDLRAKFTGTPEKVVQLFTHLAEEVREILASLGVASLAEIVGRTDMLSQVSRGNAALDDLDLNPILVQANSEPKSGRIEGRNEVPDTLDALIVKDASAALERGQRMQLSYNVENTQRAIGTRLSSHITRRFGMTGLKEETITIRLRGSAGQSLGAFAVQGVKLEVLGDANDYVGKGLSGGLITLRKMAASGLTPEHNTIIGNTVLYGATAGAMFASGQAGERMCVRNSGATAVVEGCGSNGCEYMTGGRVVVLGEVGNNFGAGMTGGMAYIYDDAGSFTSNYNP
ncbi:MAG: glutamate synthase large subunit, partial [Alphaproteobacteria bacterium]|nr:glutamate synthase large subunit [Alphaproteobacteria bacterium]